MKQDNKYTEIMKQLNYKPIGSVLLRLCGVMSMYKIIISIIIFICLRLLFAISIGEKCIGC
jgi:hypothetical protein